MPFSRRGALVSATAALSLAAAAPLALAAQEAAADPAVTSTAPAAGTDGLFDTIGGLLGGVTGLLNGLLGTSQTTALSGVTGQLQTGAVPSATTLAPVAGWLSTVSATGGLPSQLTTAASQVSALLTNPAAPSAALPVPTLDVLTALLAQIQSTSGLSALGSSTLGGLISAITNAASTVTGGTGGGSTALPVVGSLALGTESVAPLTALATTLSGGSLATGSLLAPVTALLRQVAALPGVDALVGAQLVQLANQVDAQTGTLSSGLLSSLVGTLQSIAATPGVPAPVAGVVGTVAGILGGSSTGGPTPVTTTPGGTTTTPGTKSGLPAGGGAAQIGRARISSVKVDRKLGRVRVALSCPVTGPACKTFVAAYRGTKMAGASPLLTIPAGGSLARYVKLDTASRRAIKRATTRFKVAALLPGGQTVTKDAVAKLPKKKKAARR
jgi:hypothetical protein